VKAPTFAPMELARRQATLLTHHLYSMPILLLMVHSACNCACVMCDIWKANRFRKEISRETLERHLEDIRKLNVRRVVLTGGEALMHSNLWALCELLATLPVQITLLSTGLLLKRSATDVVRWCDDVIVSLDGSREVHDGIRNVPRAFERLAEGVQSLKAIDPGFRITGRCVIQRQNFADLPNIVEAAHEIGLDQISFLAADVSTTAFGRPQAGEQERVSDVALTTAETAAFATIVEQTIERYAADFASGFIAESPDKLRRMVRYCGAINGEGEFPTTVCNAPWVSSVVEADGTVRPCFFHRALGNVNERPLAEILNSDDAVAFRRNLDVTTDPICRKCVCTLYLGPRAPV
jgi:MoaA/NifB/PqqE/SkfB family radical SAM enzyme